MMIQCLGSVLLGAVLGATSVSAQDRPEGGYRIGAGDVLSIIVWKNPDLTMTVPVRPDGWISLPLVNDVRAKDRTPMELQKSLAEAFSEFITAPVVSVIVTQVRSFKVSILGKVASPSRYELEGPATVLDALAMAGGPTEYADLDDMFVLRPLGDNYRRIPVKYSTAIRANGKSVNVVLAPGDIVVVP